jgi:hypothetical protein
VKIHKAKDISSSLQKKGFQMQVAGGHLRFIFVFGDKITQIHTKLSMGGHSRDPAKDNLQKMKRDLKFDNYQDFSDLIECTYSEQQYINMLQQKNML